MGEGRVFVGQEGPAVDETPPTAAESVQRLANLLAEEEVLLVNEMEAETNAANLTMRVTGAVQGLFPRERNSPLVAGVVEALMDRGVTEDRKIRALLEAAQRNVAGDKGRRRSPPIQMFHGHLMRMAGLGI